MSSRAKTVPVNGLRRPTAAPYLEQHQPQVIRKEQPRRGADFENPTVALVGSGLAERQNPRSRRSDDIFGTHRLFSMHRCGCFGCALTGSCTYTVTSVFESCCTWHRRVRPGVARLVPQRSFQKMDLSLMNQENWA